MTQANEALLPELKHWRLERDVEAIAWLIFDKHDARANVLSGEVLQELGLAIDKAESLVQAGAIKGLGLLSGKPGGFVFGADISEFGQWQTEAEIAQGMRLAHDLFARIENLQCPTAVGIDGMCLGGGLELALAFKTIIATKSDGTRLGFPEVKLGLFPGFGGTARSMDRCGGQAALTAMLTGKPYSAKAAKAMGLVDALVEDAHGLHWAVRKAILKPRAPRKLPLAARATRWPGVRSIVANKAKKMTAEKVREDHYPAPFAIIEHYRQHGGSRKALLQGEIDVFPKLMLGETSKNLQRVFFLQDRLKKQAKHKFKAKRVHVVGAGLMGGDIAAYCALQGLEVSLQDLDMERIKPALKRGAKLFGKKLRGAAIKAAEARFIPDPDGTHISRADVIIEAIVEKLDIKQKLFADLEAKARPDALLATNTSALPLEDIAQGLKDPSRLIGLHFFNPAAVMPLVEVVEGSQSDPDLVARGLAFAAQIKKTPLRVKSAKGFLVNRVLLPYMFAALNKMAEGTPKEEIDAAMIKFGMPMGPIELTDQVGLDVGMYVGQTLDIGDGPGAALLTEKIDQGKLGMKAGEGFYKWENRKPVRDISAYDEQDTSALADELIGHMIRECKAVVVEGVVEDADLADIGVIFGTGFAPFRGGPLHYDATQRPSFDTPQT